MTRRPSKPVRGALSPIGERLFSPADPFEALEGARDIPLDRLVPNPAQPRRVLDAAKLGELAADIAGQGILQPILVRPLGDGRYEIVAGERRYRAAGMAGLTTIPALIRTMSADEALLATISENEQREDL